MKVSLDGAAPNEPFKCYHNCEVCVLRNGKGSRDGIAIPERPARYVEEREEEEMPTPVLTTPFYMNSNLEDAPIREKMREETGSDGKPKRRHRGGRRSGSSRGPKPAGEGKAENQGQKPQQPKGGEEKRSGGKPQQGGRPQGQKQTGRSQGQKTQQSQKPQGGKPQSQKQSPKAQGQKPQQPRPEAKEGGEEVKRRRRPAHRGGRRRSGGKPGEGGGAPSAPKGE